MKPEFAFRTITDVTLTHVNFRKELHGNDHVQAVDLSMAVDVQNTRLDDFQPGLREALYWNADASAGQADIDGVPATLPNLRFPRLNGGKFALDDRKSKTKLAGYELTIEYGLGDDISNMALDCCKVVKRAIECKEGGTITLTWQVKYSGDRLDQDTCGKLALLEQDLIAIRLIPPLVAPVADEDPRDDILGDEDGNGEGDPSAEDLFMAGAEAE
jgi:hypothetical protein